MFFQCTYYKDCGESRVDQGSHLIETPSRERAAGYVRSEHERTGMDVLMQRIYTADDGIAPPGYKFETQQIWVGRGSDPGWVRQWFKDNIDQNMVCVWCSCSLVDKHKPCSAPDGDGHLFSKKG